MPGKWDKNDLNQLLALTPVNLIMFMVGFGGGIAPVLNWLRQHLSTEQISTIGSVYFLGRAVGPFVQASLIDRRGRNVLFVATASLLCLQYAVLLSTAPDVVYAHYVARVALGLASGILQSTMGAYVGENCSPRSRGVFSSIIFLHNSVGLMTAYVLSAYCSYRTLNAFAGLVSVITLVSALFLLREPAHFLLMKGREEEARRNFAWLRGDDAEARDEFSQIRDYIEREGEGAETTTRHHLSAIEIKGVVILLLLTLLLALCGTQTVDIYNTIIFADATFLSPSQWSIVYAAMGLCTLSVGTALIERFPRRTLFLFISLVMLCTFTGAGFLFTTKAPAVAKFLVLSVGVSVANGFPLLAAVRSELLSQRAKGMGSAISIVVGAIAGFFSSRLFLPVRAALGIEVNFYISAAFATLLSIFVYFFLPETRAKTLVNIQLEMRQRWSVK